jgi:hypothetical protein
MDAGGHVPFDWLQSRVPPAVAGRGAAARKRMTEDEVRTRAGLLRRLGRDQAQATRRCLANLAWGYEGAGKRPLTDAEVKAIVAAVYR